MPEPTKKRRTHFFAGCIIVVLAFLGPGALLLAPTEAPAVPPITWSPASLTAQMVAGETQTVPVSFTTTEFVADAVLRVVPELAPFIHVEPSAWHAIDKGELVELSVTVSIPTSHSLGVVDGTIHLRSDTASNRTFSKPLPIVIAISRIQLAVQPLALTASIPTSVVAHIPILDRGLIGVTLERIDEGGHVLVQLGSMNDDGFDGDEMANDGLYTFTTLMNEKTPGPLLLRARAVFYGLDHPLFSTTEHLDILPAVDDMGPEELMTRVTEKLLTARKLDDLLVFFHEALHRRLQQSRFPMQGIGELFQTARLDWKTQKRAQFTLTIVGPEGEPLGSTVHLEKFPEGWKIVEF